MLFDFTLVKQCDRELVTDAKLVQYEVVNTQHRQLICIPRFATPKLRHVKRSERFTESQVVTVEGKRSSLCFTYSVTDGGNRG